MLAPDFCASSKVNMMAPSGVNSRWNSSGATDASPRVTRPASSRTYPTTMIMTRPMNSARFSLPTNRPKNRNTSTPRSRTRHDSVLTFSRKSPSRR